MWSILQSTVRKMLHVRHERDLSSLGITAPVTGTQKQNTLQCNKNLKYWQVHEQQNCFFFPHAKWNDMYQPGMASLSHLWVNKWIYAKWSCLFLFQLVFLTLSKVIIPYRLHINCLKELLSTSSPEQTPLPNPELHCCTTFFLDATFTFCFTCLISLWVEFRQFKSRSLNWLRAYVLFFFPTRFWRHIEVRTRNHIAK